MNNPLPWFPLYAAEFHAATCHLTLEQDGTLNRLWRVLWNMSGCSIPDDEEWISLRLNVRTKDEYLRAVQPVIDEFFVRNNGRLHSPRLTSILDAQREKHRKKSRAGKMGAEAKHLKRVNSDSGNA